ncbi:hypothetical protein F5Y16DRAFT_66394 [Xylariaceae sp. FL0255]|nr:hypothetical protein F5Y16DRAFT_66394 [Xylariaceae sp. FL0255]
MVNQAWPAWEVRDQADEAEIYYNHPLRAKNKRLEDENMSLKRLLREHGIPWNEDTKATPQATTRITRSSRCANRALPYLPVEIQLRVLSYAMTSPHPIVDPLCKLKQDLLLPHEKAKAGNKIAIHFLSTCRAYHEEGRKFLWANNSFVFTSPTALRDFSEVAPVFRESIRHVTLRLAAKFYDDEERDHRLPRSYHRDLKGQVKLIVQRRPKENTLARRGFRAYAWYQLCDFLKAMMPPYHPSLPAPSSPSPRPRLFPSLETLRIDCINFTEDLLTYPPAQLHELATHQLGYTLNELILTGIPPDDGGLRAITELTGLLKDEGLLIDHGPTMVLNKHGLRTLHCDDNECNYSPKVVRAMRRLAPYQSYLDEHHRLDGVDFPAAPPAEGEPPFSENFSCRTMWKKVPVKIDGSDERRWELFDRISGRPWEDVEEDATMFDYVDDDEIGMVCENCGEPHPGALLPDEGFMDFYDDV